MTHSAKGTTENPGKMVKQTSGLNREIVNQGWCERNRQLEYNAHWTGKLVQRVQPKFASKLCHSYGHKGKENREKQATVFCKSWNNSPTVVGLKEIIMNGIGATIKSVAHNAIHLHLN